MCALGFFSAGFLSSLVGAQSASAVLAAKLLKRLITQRPHDHSIPEVDYEHSSGAPASPCLGRDRDLTVSGHGHHVGSLAHGVIISSALIIVRQGRERRGPGQGGRAGGRAGPGSPTDWTRPPASPSSATTSTRSGARCGGRRGRCATAKNRRAAAGASGPERPGPQRGDPSRMSLRTGWAAGNRSRLVRAVHVSGVEASDLLEGWFTYDLSSRLLGT